MQFNFKNEIAKKSDADLIDCYKHWEQYQESYIAEVEQELKRRGIEYGHYKIENERRKQIR
jgi:hypothetical protein